MDKLSKQECGRSRSQLMLLDVVASVVPVAGTATTDVAATDCYQCTDNACANDVATTDVATTNVVATTDIATTDVAAATQKTLLAKESLDFVVEKIKSKLTKLHRKDNSVEVWSDERFVQARTGYIEFLQQDSATRVLTDHDVKDFWLTHMLFTREYADFCRRIFGDFLHCNLKCPQLFGAKSDDKLEMCNDQQNTQVCRTGLAVRTSSPQERVDMLNLEPIRDKMKHQFPSWTLKKHDQVTREYKRYLILILTHGNVAPSSDVDEMWHTHIWSSRNYAHDCSQVLGRKFIHHAPERKPGPKSRSAKSFKNTLDKYKEVFGEAAPQDIWGKKRTKGSMVKDNQDGCGPEDGCGCNKSCSSPGGCANPCSDPSQCIIGDSLDTCPRECLVPTCVEECDPACSKCESNLATAECALVGVCGGECGECEDSNSATQTGCTAYIRACTWKYQEGDCSNCSYECNARCSFCNEISCDPDCEHS
jgi:hypothetical protein